MILRIALPAGFIGLLGLLLAASSTGCTAPEPAHVAPGTDADVLRRADREFADDVAIRGLEAWLEWFTPEAVKLDMHAPPNIGRASIAELDAPIFADPDLRLTWEPDLAIWLEPGHRGFTRGSWRISQRAADGTPSNVASGRYVTLWVRTEAGWRVELDLGVLDE